MTDLTRRAFGKFMLAATSATLIAGTASADGHSTNHKVTISGHKFSPRNLTISAGDTVTFVNNDGAPHTATAKNKSFDTGRLGQGSNATIKFSTAGNINYICAFHPSMKGKITVEG